MVNLKEKVWLWNLKEKVWFLYVGKFKANSLFFTHYSVGDAEICHLALTILNLYNKDILFAD